MRLFWAAPSYKNFWIVHLTSRSTLRRASDAKASKRLYVEEDEKKTLPSHALYGLVEEKLGGGAQSSVESNESWTNMKG